LQHVMFDVDGTLVRSQQFDSDCYVAAVYEVLGYRLDGDWTRYTHISDRGILDQYISENGLDARRNKIQRAVKAVFTQKIADILDRKPARQVPGAASFLSRLGRQQNLCLSIATGGWRETAVMKLTSAGIDVSGLPIASSNDHGSRIEIMQTARQSATADSDLPCTYFGDAEWDRQACEQLGYNFVLVGDRTTHHQQITDFSSSEQALAFIGL